jgi:hypothetical protein
MLLTPEQHAYIAQRAQWYFDVQPPLRNSTALADNCVFTGDGLDDLNRTIGFLSVNPTLRVICEVGANGTAPLGNAYPKYLPCDVTDVYAIKDAFIAFYGSVDKPDAYAIPPGAAMINPSQP